MTSPPAGPFVLSEGTRHRPALTESSRLPLRRPEGATANHVPRLVSYGDRQTAGAMLLFRRNRLPASYWPLILDKRSYAGP